MKSILIANICPPTKILGVTVYNPLPAKHFVDLDHECVIPIGGPIHPHDIDDIIEDIQRAGTLPNGVAWGITSRNDRGFANILVDADEVDEKTIEHLIEMKVVITPLNFYYMKKFDNYRLNLPVPENLLTDVGRTDHL